MNELLSKIKDLIKSNILLEDDEYTNPINSRTETDSIVKNLDAGATNPNDLGDQDSAAELAGWQAYKSYREAERRRLSTGYVDKNGKYHFTYRAKDDDRNWVSGQMYVPFPSNTGGEINVPLTLETVMFLKRLFSDLGEVSVNENGVSMERFPGLDIRVSKIPTSEKKNFKEIIDNMPQSFLTNTLVTDVASLLENDDRFNPDNYVIDITSKNNTNGGEAINSLLDEISSYYDKNDFIGKNDDGIRGIINGSKSHVAIRIFKDFTLLPLYSEHQYPPKSSRRGALDKMLWLYKNFAELKRRSAIELIDALKNRKYREKLGIEPGEQVELIRQVFCPNDNQYVRVPVGENHSSALEPEAVFSLLSDFYSDKKVKNTYAIALVSDIGESYIIKTSPGPNGKYIFKYVSNGNGDASFGKMTNSFLEGFITRDEYMSSIGYGALDDKKKELIDSFVLDENCEAFYTLKMMFCDKVDVEYIADLPENVLTEYGAGEKITALPESIRVPGSQHAVKTNSYLIRKLNMNNEIESSIRTISKDVLNKGSGGFGFMYKSMGYRGDSSITADMISNSLTSLKNLGYLISTLISEMYARVSVDSLKQAMADNTLSTYSTKHAYINPGSKSVKAILDSTTVSDGKFENLIPLSYAEGSGFEKTVKSDFDMVYEMVRQLLMQYGKMVKKLMPNEKEMLGEITGIIQLESASPTNLERIENGLIQNVNSCNNYLDIANDVLIDMNIDTDLGLMINSFFKHLGLEIDEKKKKSESRKPTSHSVKENNIPQSIFTTDIGTLNIGRSRIEIKKDDRWTLVKNILTFEKTYANNIDIAMMNILRGKISQTTSFNGETAIKPLVKVMKDLYDWYKTLYNLAEMDGQVKGESNANNIKIVTGMKSSVETNFTGNELKLESVPSDIGQAIANAMRTANKSDIQSGLAIDENVKGILAPAARLVRRAVSNYRISNKKRNDGYIGLTGIDTELPYSPIHTIVTAFDDGSGIQFVVISSLIGFYADNSEYEYSYENDCVQVKRQVVDKDGKKGMEILPSDNDREEFKKRMESRSFAHFIYMASNIKNMEKEVLERIKKMDVSARKSFDAVLNEVDEYGIFYKENQNPETIKQFMENDSTWREAMEHMSRSEEIRSAIGTIDRYIRTACVLLYDGAY